MEKHKNTGHSLYMCSQNIRLFIFCHNRSNISWSPFQEKVLRQIFGKMKWQDDKKSCMTDNCVIKVFCKILVIWPDQDGRQVVWKGEMRKHSQCRPCTWEDNVKMYFKEREGWVCVLVLWVWCQLSESIKVGESLD